MARIAPAQAFRRKVQAPFNLDWQGSVEHHRPRGFSVLSFSTLLLLGMALASAPPAAPGRDEAGVVYEKRRLLMRVPVRGRTQPAADEWVEKGSRRCIQPRALAGAIIRSTDIVDLVLEGGERWRIKLRDTCPALGFYGGFYLRPAADGEICARREAIHTRSGSECEIGSFKKLVPRRKSPGNP